MRTEKVQGINEDFASFDPVDIPDKNALYRQNLNIWELLQPEEENFEDEDFSMGLDNGRWVTVEQEDAGDEDETVLFRTFVNAEIGGKRYRMKSKGAPYLLLLSTKEGESEPRVTICNQSGTLGMSRECKRLPSKFPGWTLIRPQSRLKILDLLYCLRARCRVQRRLWVSKWLVMKLYR